MIHPIFNCWKVLVSHPFDLLKVIHQASTTHSSSFAITKNIIRKDGFRGLYRGVSPVLLGTPPILASNFLSYHLCQKYLYEWQTKSTYNSIDQLSLFQVGLSGFLAAIPTTFIIAPAEQIKIKLQLGDGSKSAFSVFKSIYLESGVKGNPPRTS